MSEHTKHIEVKIRSSPLKQPDANMIKEHYEGETSPSVAKVYWSITPTEADNIIKMKSA